MNKDRLSQLSFEEKKELLGRILKQKTSTHKQFNCTKISPYPRDKPIPASIIQQEIWFHENLVQNSNAYNIPITLEITGNLNYSALVQAFRIVISRYEVLRTSFYTLRGVPHQNILNHLDFNLNVIDLKNLFKEIQEKTAMDLLFQFSKKNFILDKAPLFRVLCMELSSNKYILAFVIHHLLCDNWSLTLLIQEILTLFNQISIGVPTEQNSPSYQYADYCFWEKEMLLSDETKSKIDFLKNKLSHFNFELKLPYDYPKNIIERATAKSKQFTLDRAYNEKIAIVCQTLQITPYIFFFVIYHSLIYKYTFQSNIVIGTSFLNRPQNEEENLMGPFINVALIDSTISSEITFEDLARQLKTTILEMHSYRFIPLNKMIKSMNSLSKQELSLTQIFYGFLNFEFNQVSSPSTQELSVKLLNQSNELRVYNVAKFELDLTMWKDDTDMGGSLEYMSNVFKEETIDLLIEHYKQLCNLMINNPKTQLSDIVLYDSFNKIEAPLEAQAIFTFG